MALRKSIKMNTKKSPESTAVTTNKKGLRQARLPFKPLSDGSPIPPKRKRKLSEPVVEGVAKVGKIAKENNEEDCIVIVSDDDNLEEPSTPNIFVKMNPCYVKLVDTVVIKKCLKTKMKADKNTPKISSPTNENTECTMNTSVIAKNIDEKVSECKKASLNKATVICPPPSIVQRKPLNRKGKLENNLDVSSSSSKLDESISSETSTLRKSRSSSIVNSQGDDSYSTDHNTPNQAPKKLRASKQKLGGEEERQRKRDDRERQKQAKEEQMKKQKQEKEDAKRRQKEEKNELRRKEKEEKEKQRELERKEKEEQKRIEKEEKELQRRIEKEAKEEEKRKKQEAMELERQELELKNKKTVDAFVNFFVPKQKPNKIEKAIETSQNSLLSTFTIKADMCLAPTCRHKLSDSDKIKLDNFIKHQELPASKLYLHTLKKGVVKPLVSGKTRRLEFKDDDVIIIEDELPPGNGADALITCGTAVREELRPKLLRFYENNRPPYYGTWRKTSTLIKPRRPFGKDEKLLDYECDSDEEWEEEQEGESIDGSAAGSDDGMEADEYEVDNEVFVPHGYLSDEETTMDEDNVLSLSPETQKQKLKDLEKEFESELKKPKEKLKPRLYGLLYANSDGKKRDDCVDVQWNYFGKCAMLVCNDIQVAPPESSVEPEKKKSKKKKAEADQGTAKQEKKKKSPNETKVPKKSKLDKRVSDVKRNQPGINSFLKKLKPS